MIHLTVNGKNSKASIMTNNIDENSKEQIREILNHPACTNPVSIMPDVHSGKGIVIGFTMEMNDKVVPNWVGVDINCGMLYQPISLIDMETFDNIVNENIPSGMNIHDKPIVDFEKDFDWDLVNNMSKEFSKKYKEKFGVDVVPVKYDYDWFKDKCKSIGTNHLKVECAIGTLGGGNHFISIEQSKETGVSYLIIHTGSRNFGKRICDFHNKKIENINNNGDDRIIKEKVAEILKDESNKKDRVELIKRVKMECIVEPVDYLDGEDAIDYLFDMIFAQEYANFNRRTIADSIISSKIMAIGYHSQTCHNFIDFNDWIVRKGAIRAYENEQVIVPLNMRDGSLLCVGKSNKEWNNSGPHGAGRVFSRTKAKKVIDFDDYKNQMKDIYTTSVSENTLDEAPDAYKPKNEIENAIDETLTVTDHLIPLYNFKDDSEPINWRKNGK